MPISLPPDTRRELAAALQRYFLAERDEVIGDLQATLLLDFIVEEIGPSLYNQALRDTQARLHAAVDDVELALEEPELAYTARHRSSRRR